MNTLPTRHATNHHQHTTSAPPARTLKTTHSRPWMRSMVESGLSLVGFMLPLLSMLSQALEARDWPVAHDLIDPPPVSSASVASAASAASSSPSGGVQVQVQTVQTDRPGEALLHEAIQEVDWATRWPLGAGALAEAEVLSARMLLDNAVVVDALREVRTTGVRRCTHVCEDVCERVLYARVLYARVRRCTEVYERVRTCTNVYERVRTCRGGRDDCDELSASPLAPLSLSTSV